MVPQLRLTHLRNASPMPSSRRRLYPNKLRCTGKYSAAQASKRRLTPSLLSHLTRLSGDLNPLHVRFLDFTLSLESKYGFDCLRSFLNSLPSEASTNLFFTVFASWVSRESTSWRRTALSAISRSALRAVYTLARRSWPRCGRSATRSSSVRCSLYLFPQVNKTFLVSWVSGLAILL